MSALPDWLTSNLNYLSAAVVAVPLAHAAELVAIWVTYSALVAPVVSSFQAFDGDSL